MSVIDKYLETVKPSQRPELERVRDIVKKLVPDPEETISYGMPAICHKGKVVVYFGAFKNHMALYPRTNKFTEDDPLPESVIKKIVENRLKGIVKD